MSDKKTASKAVFKPVNLKAHKLERAGKILDYIERCMAAEVKVDKAFITELGTLV